jgi:hypothetical protein
MVDGAKNVSLERLTYERSAEESIPRWFGSLPFSQDRLS